MTIKYQFDVDLADPNNGHSLIHQLAVSSGKPAMEVLEIGCSSGYVGATLVAKGHRVTGVELDPEAAEAARSALQEVFTGDADAFFRAHPDRRFDAILLGDVLEHMAEPGATLARCASRLTPEGALAISLPCVAHGSIRAMLLEGRWDYADYGLLDRTHLRFFSYQGMLDLLAGAGLRIEKLHAVLMPIETASREYGMNLTAESIAAVESLAKDDGLLDFQYLILARPAAPEGLAERNAAVPVQRIPAPRRPGEKSAAQQWRVGAFRRLLGGIARRRFRGAERAG
ncbi:class I SAM-dependent methyltransferase [Luteimonas gilva]|uniref:Class I SAM-dependent methyltransferase n=1 Tax=Luteimonas gilva TaxID=2572684 RepID=A0A4U5JXT4_9GAMM|nr:class I SAM-dependent methyltransferase [Luteimonas gilva]TKR33578.1 class I SAM-dependent methyltransferase [Luteimonas gilva]